MNINTFERLFRIENLGIELDDKNSKCVIVRFDNAVDRNKKSGDDAKSKNASDMHNHFVCYEFDYVNFVGSNPTHDPEPIVIGENRCLLERRMRDQSQFEFALGFLKLDSSRKFGLANETTTVNDVYRFKCDLKKRKINEVSRGQPVQVRSISKKKEGKQPSKNNRSELEQYIDVDSIRVKTRVENKERLSKLRFNWKSDEEGRVEFLTSRDSQAFSGIKRGPCNCRLTIPLICPPETELTFRFFSEKIHGLRTLVGEQTFVFKDILDTSIEREKNREQQADESTDKGSGNAAMENPNEQKKDRTGQNGDNSTEQTAVNNPLESFSDEESRKETQQAGEIGAKDAGSTDATIRADAEEEGERSCSNTEKQIDDRFCELRTKLDKAFYKIEQVHDKIETDFRPKFEDTFNEKFKDAFEQGLVSTLPEEIERHLSRYVTQDSLSERLKAFDDLQVKLEEQKKRLDDQKKEIDSIQTEVLNKRVKELLEQFRNNVFKATIEPLQNKVDGLSSVLEEKVSRKILEKTDELIDSSLESIKTDLLWLLEKIPKIEDVLKSFSSFQEEIRQVVATPSTELEKERKVKKLMSNIQLDPVVKNQDVNTTLTNCKEDFRCFEDAFYRTLLEAAPSDIKRGDSPQFKTFKEIARPVIDKINAISQKMTVDGKKIIDQEIESRDVMDFKTFQNWFLNTEEALALFRQDQPMPDMEAEYVKYLNKSVNDMWASYVAKRTEAFSSVYSDEQQYQADFDDLAEFIFIDFSKDGFEKIMEWQNQFPDEQRKTKEEIDAVRKNILDLCDIEEIAVKPCEEHFNPEFHSKQGEIKDSSYPNNMVIKALGKGYKIGKSGRVIRRAAVQVNLR